MKTIRPKAGRHAIRGMSRIVMPFQREFPLKVRRISLIPPGSIVREAWVGVGTSLNSACRDFVTQHPEIHVELKRKQETTGKP